MSPKIDMVVNQFVRQADRTVRSRRSLTGIIGSLACVFSTYMKMSRKTADNGRLMNTSGCFQGTRLPPELRPKRRRTSVIIRVKAPRTSIRFQVGLLASLTGMSTRKNTNMPEITVSGTWIKKAVLHPHVSLTKPPKTPPSPAPTP